MPQQLPQAQARLVELRLGVADGAVHHLGDFVVLVAVHIVEQEHLPVAGGKLLDGVFQCNAVDGAHQQRVLLADFALGAFAGLVGVDGFVERNLRQLLLAQVHQHHVHRQPMQPGRKRRLAAESLNLAEELQESFLGHFFRFRGVAQHAQAERIDPALVQVVEALERLAVAALGAADRLRLRHLLRAWTHRPSRDSVFFPQVPTTRRSPAAVQNTRDSQN